jgi:flavin reductase (DIM6/NTAB) family NADH-FMN oxidoreductase RutF
MAKVSWKAGNMIYPVPAVMISCGDLEGAHNIITVAWTGTVCTNPPMAYISIKPERYSYGIIEKNKEFVINLTTEDLVKATDFCGVRSGRDIDKFKEMKLTPEKAQKVKAPLIKESPVNIECVVKQIIKMGSHDMFIAEVVAVNVEDKYFDRNNKFHLENTNPICYSHGEYYTLGNAVGKFGYSVKKKK